MRQEIKKHVTQMTSKEVNFLLAYVAIQEPITFELSYHAIDRLQEKGKGVSAQNLIDLLTHHTIIEYKELAIDGKGARRVVIRGIEQVHNSNLVAVLDLTNKCIITIWLNDTNDKHATLNLKEYKNFKIV